MTDTNQHASPRSGPDCGSFADLLPLLGVGTLEAREEDRLHLHLATCAYCQLQQATYNRMDLAMRRYFGASASLLLSPEDSMSLTDQEPMTEPPLRAPSALSRSPLPRPRRVLTWVAAVAAVMVMALLTTALFISHLPSGPEMSNHPSKTTGSSSGVTVYGSADYTDDSSADSTLFALDGVTGKPRWTNTSTTTDRAFPVVENGVFYIGASDGSVSAYRTSDGTLLWSQKLLDNSFVDQVADDVVIAHSFDQSSGHDPFPGTIFALDASTGHELWHVAKSVIPQAFVDGTIYAAKEGDLSIQHGVLYALNAKDGSERWELQTQGSPSVEQVVGGQVYVVGQRVVGNGPNEQVVLYAVDAATGQEHWSYPKNPAYLLGPVAVANSLVFILSNTGNGATLPNELDAVSTSDGSLRWHAQLDLPYMQALYDHGVIYVGMDGAIAAYQASDGQLLSNTPTTKGAALALVANGVYYLDASTGLYAVDARSGKELWHSEQAGSIEAVVNGLIYITAAEDAPQQNNVVSALDAGTGKVRWTYKLGHDVPYHLIVK